MIIYYDEGLVEDYIDKNIVKPVLKLIEQTIEDAGKDPSEWEFLNLSISLNDTELKYIDAFGRKQILFSGSWKKIFMCIFAIKNCISQKREDLEFSFLIT